MNERIALVDDDQISLTVVRSFLERAGYLVSAHLDPRDLLESFTRGDFDLVISDLNMPVVDGADFLKLFRQRDPETPFIFLTVEDNLSTGIRMVREGAQDFITKPVREERLILTVENTIRDSRLASQIKQVEHEKSLLDMENHQLLSWRAMYASKDTTQTEQLITLLTRTVNAAGGYMWLDLLDSLAVPLADGRMALPDDLVNLIKESTTSQKKIFEFLTYLSRLESLELDLTPHSVHTFAEETILFLDQIMGELCGRYQRPWQAVRLQGAPDGQIVLDPVICSQIIRELTINAIKYSPAGSPILAEVETERQGSNELLKISLRNFPREMQARAADGGKVTGIPYEYSERVFDLFYTIDAYPTQLPEEEWTDGAGLYISRKLLKRQNAWLKNVNGIDYTTPTPQAFVRFSITIPFVKEPSDAR